MPRAVAAVRKGGVRGSAPSQDHVRSLYDLCSTALVCVLLIPLLAVRIPILSRVLLAIVLLDTSFPIDISLVHRDDLALLSAIGGFNISLTTLVLPALYASWILSSLSEGRFAARLRVSTPLVTYTGVVIVSVFYAYDSSMVLRELSVLVPIFLTHVYIASSTTSRRDVIYVVTFLISGLALQGFLAVVIGTTGLSLDAGPLHLGVLSAEDAGVRRVSGAFGHPNAFAAYLAMLLAPALSLTLTNLPFYVRLLGVIAFAWGASALLLTVSRGGLMAFAMSMILFCVAASRKRKSWLVVHFIMAVVVLVFMFAFQTGFGSRFTDDGGAAAVRVPLALTALEIIRDHPLLGIGANNFTTVVGHHTYVKTFKGDWLSTVHNKYLLVGSETGLIGLAAFLWLLTASLRASWLGWKRRDPLFAPLFLGFGAALAGEMIHMAVDIFNLRSIIQLLLIIVALLVAMQAQEVTAAVRSAQQGRELFSRAP